MTLRARLLIALVALLATGVLIIDVAAVASLRTYLLDQVDQQLAGSLNPVLRRVAPPSSTADPTPRGGFGITDFYVEIREADGSIAVRLPSVLRDEGDPTPSVSNDFANAHADGQPVTVGSTDNSDFKYRAVIVRNAATGELVIVAAPLKNVDDTVGRLVAIETVISIVVLVVLAGVGFLVIRSDLRPLEDMTDTAQAIGAGDLARRIDKADTQTEVGKLGSALNAMLSQIEASFAERQASEDRLRRFAADASHELRTPLTAIRGYAELHRQGAVTSEEHLQRIMGRIENEAARMGVMVDDLLLLARLDQGRPMETADVDISSLVHNVVSDAGAVQPSRSIVCQVADEQLVVQGDAARLQQVFTNLVSNALNHTPEGTPIQVTAQRNEDQIVVSVADEGPGIEPDALEKVFERFYRVDAGRSRAEGGTGLGLAIVQAIVQAHSGTVSVQSTLGEGAKFTVCLPTVLPPA